MVIEFLFKSRGIIIGILALGGAFYTIYRKYIKGPDIKLIITQDWHPGEHKKFKFGYKKIGKNTEGIALPFNAVFVNEGGRSGTLMPIFSRPIVIKILPDGIDSNEAKYFAPSLSVYLEFKKHTKLEIKDFPITLGVGENLPIPFEFHINAGAENINKIVNDYDFFKVIIQYKVTTRKGIEIKEKEIKIEMEGGEIT